MADSEVSMSSLDGDVAESSVRGTANPLGIRHLLVWTLLVAVSLAAIRVLAAQSLPQSSPGMIVVLVMGAIGLGTQLSSLLYFAECRWRSRRFPVYDGERLWLVDTIALLVRLIPPLILMAYSTSQKKLVILICSLMFGLSVFYLSQAFFVRTQRWLYVFLHNSGATFLIAGFLSGNEGKLLIALIGFCVFFQLLSNVGAIFIDATTGERKPWSHRVGAILPFWNWATLFAGVFLFLSRR
jgi:hypothetical protein